MFKSTGSKLNQLSSINSITKRTFHSLKDASRSRGLTFGVAACQARTLVTMMHRDFSFSRDQVLSELKDILGEFDRVDISKFHETATFKDIGLDSLDGVEAVVAIEEKFDIVLPDEEAQQLTGVDSALESILKRVG